MLKHWKKNICQNYKNMKIILFYNKEEDYFVCPMGQHMKNVGNSTRENASGYVSNITYYEAKNCNGCPLRCLCHQAKENRRIEVNHKLNQYRQKAGKLLRSSEGRYHRRKRAIEPESVFGQSKSNKQYDRFRHFGSAGKEADDKVKMDFAIFAIAFNIGKLYNKKQNASKKQKKSSVFTKNTRFFVVIWILPCKKSAQHKFIATSLKWVA
jgi:hypothetical protein